MCNSIEQAAYQASLDGTGTSVCGFGASVAGCAGGFGASPANFSSGKWIAQPGLIPGYRAFVLRPGVTAVASDYSPGFLPCPSGWLCPPAFTCALPCGPGWYCPLAFLDVNGTVCLPYNTAPVAGLCGSAAMPFPCPEGNFCPNTSAFEQCPLGNTCMSGSQAPRKCTLLQTCPAGSARVTFDWMVLVIGVAMAAVVLVVLVLSRYAPRCDHRDPEDRDVDEMVAFLYGRNSVNPPRGGMHESLLLNDAHQFGVDIVVNNLSVAVPATRSWWKCLVSWFFCCQSRGARDGVGSPPSGTRFALYNVTMNFKAGECHLLLGPSGCGKSTLVNVLASRHAANNQRIVSGSVEYCTAGTRYTATDIRTQVALVPQDDILNPLLTVREWLSLSLRLRTGIVCETLECRQRIDAVIALLDLDVVKDSLIGGPDARGISGGQRKRVNIATELLGRPRVLLLDEPTSGLDSETSAKVMDVLSRVAQQGVNVVVVAHQPSLEMFDMFSSVAILAPFRSFEKQRGRPTMNDSNVAYWGIKSGNLSSSATLQRFLDSDTFQGGARHNVVDSALMYVDTCPLVMIDRYQSTGWRRLSPVRQPTALNEVVPPSGVYAHDVPRIPPIKWSVQFVLFGVRAMLQFQATMAAVFFGLLSVTLVAALLAKVYGDNLPVNFSMITFLIAAIVGFQSCMLALRTFMPLEHMFQHEMAVGLSATAFVFANVLVDLIKCALVPAFLLMIYPTLLSPHESYLSMYALTFGVCFAAWGFAYVLGALFKGTSAFLGAVGYCLLCIMFSGITPSLASLREIGGFWVFLANFSYSRWMTEAMFYAETSSWTPYWVSSSHAQANAIGFEYASNIVNRNFLYLIIYGVGARVITVILYSLVVNRSFRCKVVLKC